MMSLNECNQDQNIAGRLFNELVEILVQKGDLDREQTETWMAQRLLDQRLPQEFASVARQLAFECFAVSLSSESVGSHERKREQVMQALQDWENTESTCSSKSFVRISCTYCI